MTHPISERMARAIFEIDEYQGYNQETRDNHWMLRKSGYMAKVKAALTVLLEDLPEDVIDAGRDRIPPIMDEPDTSLPLDAKEPVTDWQRMDTAPHDRPILVCDDWGGQTVIKWSHGRWSLVEVGSFAGDGDYYDAIAWKDLEPPPEWARFLKKATEDQ